jgi:hypothetical protein
MKSGSPYFIGIEASAVTQKRPYVITSKPAIENDLRH